MLSRVVIIVVADVHTHAHMTLIIILSHVRERERATLRDPTWLITGKRLRLAQSGAATNVRIFNFCTRTRAAKPNCFPPGAYSVAHVVRSADRQARTSELPAHTHTHMSRQRHRHRHRLRCRRTLRATFCLLKLYHIGYVRQSRTTNRTTLSSAIIYENSSRCDGMCARVCLCVCVHACILRTHVREATMPRNEIVLGFVGVRTYNTSVWSGGVAATAEETMKIFNEVVLVCV